ncbi:SDR family oxidoreductase [Sphingomonas melonis]|uniref:NAD(P)-dependent dehydrogenase (Short-subunit alcohol dehydrogenase family) n=1 Tax=Sphingomonas melonis TaxID=152682 RepID=A0A7Y9FQW8_9SPHN|nr:SDR family oxidoreductase [Sphingomonas melonis]NYD91542.1 NAD(P)-dependent dehydrogenase (short-subunit alcohol dehydrogenase family) [Sphingomonas melonis]
MARFENKRVLITGGTSGLGLAGATRIVAEGGTVIVTGLDPSRIRAARDVLGVKGSVLANDAADPAAASALAAVARSAGGLDGLWLNAGYAALGTPEEVTADAFDRMMAANVRGPMLQLAALSPYLREAASVVVTSSSSTYEGAAVTSLYAATKGALVAMARSWATALAPRGIRVNVLVPGPIDTGFRNFLPAEAKQGFEEFVVAQVPLGRVGTPDEAAAVALFLLSDDASYVTGGQYAVDGGLVMH